TYLYVNSEAVLQSRCRDINDLLPGPRNCDCGGPPLCHNVGRKMGAGTICVVYFCAHPGRRRFRIFGMRCEERPMKKFAYSLFAACLSLGLGLSAASGTANAAQPSAMATPSAQTSAPNVHQVQYYDYRG